jgi:hypothetical protein
MLFAAVHESGYGTSLRSPRRTILYAIGATTDIAAHPIAHL